MTQHPSSEPTPARQPIASDTAACPTPLPRYSHVVMGHGSGGRLSADLIEQIFLPAFACGPSRELRDSAILPTQNQRWAFATDSFVVRPLFFPGGCIGDLAVNGTVNDLAMSGAVPRFLSAAFIIEEGFPLSQLSAIAFSMGAAAAAAGAQIVTGDTKVVERGHGDGCYINTSGLGLVPAGLHIGPGRIQAGDAIVLSGTIGDHGMAIMSVRENLEFEATIRSDTAALHELVQRMLDVCPEIHMLRDPTRGGVAASLNEVAAAANVGIELQENQIPIDAAVQSACEILGFDPLFVANEGKLLAFVPAKDADKLVQAMRQHPLGLQAAVIGHTTDDHRQIVVGKTNMGTRRVITMPVGELLPRIC